jgi:hypothetical protein
MLAYKRSMPRSDITRHHATSRDITRHHATSRDIMNAFGAALALDQVRDRQIFNRNRVIGIDDPATVLVRKVIPLLPHLFLGANYHVPRLSDEW